MRVKKIIGLVIAVAIIMSMCVISVSATDLTEDNYSVGGGNVKGAIANNTTWTRVHSGSSDATRTSASETVNSGQSAGNGTQILQAYTNVSASDAKFVHARFRVDCTAGWGIRIRQTDGSNTQWMVFDNGGGVSGYGDTAVNLGTAWNVSTSDNTVVNEIDMVINPNTGAGYCFVNGTLASYTKNLQTDGTWHGYLVYTSGSWSGGDTFKWQYDNDLGESGKGSSYTKYVDTESHTVTIEEVFDHKGLSQSFGTATLFSNANYSVGGGNVKGAIANNTTWTRVHSGSNDATRTSASETVNSGQSAGDGTQIIQAYTNVSASDAKFVHARFRVNCTAGWGIRIRQTDGTNTQWMIFSKDGAVSGVGGTAVNLGTWNVSTSDNTVVNEIDMVINPNTGAGYCFVNGTLASYTKSLQTDGTWHGYLVYTSGSWSGGDTFKWQYDNDLGESGKGSSYTKYVDTEIHTLTIEEVLNHKGLAPSNGGDSSLIFSNNDVADYIRGNSGATLTYPTKDSVTVEGDYYNAASGYAQGFMYMFTDNHPGYLLEDELGGNLLCISYTQVITSGSKVEMRIRAGGSNQNNNRMMFSESDGKYHVTAFDQNSSIYLNKNWGDAVNVEIIIDRFARKAYTIIDGEPLGSGWDFSSKGDFNDLRMYLNGTSSNSVSTVTFSNWLLKQYDSTKNVQRLINEERRDRVALANINEVMPTAVIPSFTAEPSVDATTLSGMTVVSGDGKDLDLTGGYTVAFGSTDYDVATAPDRFGIALYKNGSFAGCYEAKSISAGGKYGILIFGIDTVDPGATYTMKNAVKYDSDGSWIVAE